MFKDEFQAVCNAGAGKVNLMKKNPLGYFVAALVAGMFISFGSFVAFTLGQVISAGDAAPWTKPVQAFAFASALSLVVMAGAELFTGNNFVMSAASLRKKVTLGRYHQAVDLLLDRQSDRLSDLRGHLPADRNSHRGRRRGGRILYAGFCGQGRLRAAAAAGKSCFL